MPKLNHVRLDKMSVSMYFEDAGYSCDSDAARTLDTVHEAVIVFTRKALLEAQLVHTWPMVAWLSGPPAT